MYVLCADVYCACEKIAEPFAIFVPLITNLANELNVLDRESNLTHVYSVHILRGDQYFDNVLILLSATIKEFDIVILRDNSSVNFNYPCPM